MNKLKHKAPLLEKTPLIEQTAKISRSLKILPNFTGSTYLVHNGQNFKSLLITKDMVGHKFGEFFNTRAKYVFKKKKQKQKPKSSKWGKK